MYDLFHTYYEIKILSPSCLINHPPFYLFSLVTKIATSERSCVFWDFVIQAWSTNGCKVSTDDSKDDATICHCEHLTNFAVIFDFTGDAIVDYLWLDIVTYIVLSISIILLVVTQIVSHNYQRLVLAITYSKEKGLIKILLCRCTFRDHF